jgi:hypothetical protein
MGVADASAKGTTDLDIEIKRKDSSSQLQAYEGGEKLAMT